MRGGPRVGSRLVSGPWTLPTNGRWGARRRGTGRPRYSLSRGHATTRTASTDAARFFPDPLGLAGGKGGRIVKAILSHTRGGPETLVYEDGPKPRIAAGEALVRVHAAAISSTEVTRKSPGTELDGQERPPVLTRFEGSRNVGGGGVGVIEIKRGEPVYGLL